jgi:Sulfotransferase family
MTASTERSVGARAHKGRVPDFFIVGHAKSGTTALHEMLGAHPQIYMPELKETQFFARELHPTLRPSRRHPDTLERYVSLFAPAAPEQRAGEVSPSYLRSHTAAGRIAELRPDARIIAILREPTSFIRSLHLQLIQAHVETEKDLAKAIALEAARHRQQQTTDIPTPQGLFYQEHVRYVEQLRRYHAVFPREQILVLIYDDFRADNEGTLRTVLQFLEVDDSAPIALSEANPSVRVRSPRAYELERSLYMGRGRTASAVKATIKTLTPRRLRHDALTVLRRAQRGTPLPPDEVLMLELRRRFKPEVLAASEYLDRDLVTLWGYDSLD